MWPLSHEQCEQCHGPAVGEDSFCPECTRVLCRDHYDETDHICGYNFRYRGQYDRLVRCLADLDQDAMGQLIEQLRPGTPFTLKIPKSPEETDGLAGAYNLHIEVNFEDSLQWLIRVSMYGRGDGPVEVLKKITESEAATYSVLRDHKLPVPAVHDWGSGTLSRTGNPLCRHLVYDKLTGSSAAESTMALTDGEDDSDLKAFARNFAGLSVAISDIHCDSMGSLVNYDHGRLVWGPMLNGGYPESLDMPCFGGPFHSLRDLYTHRIDGLIDLIKRGLIYRRAPLLVFLALREARRLVVADEKFCRRETRFYIRHPDCSWSNILSDGPNITGLIDWEWAGSQVKDAAFASPKWAYETDAYLEGDNAITEGERLLCEAYDAIDRPDLSDCVRNGRRFHRLDDIISRWVPYFGEERALNQLNSLTRAFMGESVEVPSNLSDWMAWAKHMNRGNPDLDVITKLDDHTRQLRHRRPENKACESLVFDELKLMGWD